MSDIEMMPVKSSNLSDVGYDEAAVEMHVTFHSGKTYIYSGVDRGTYDALATAASPGSYLNRYVKNKYPARQG